MTKQCIHCGTQIPFVASRCPNCTTVLSISDTGGDSDTGAILLVALGGSAIVVGIFELFKAIFK
jgi:hypothetical protein